jgi:hypothetical protein
MTWSYYELLRERERKNGLRSVRFVRVVFNLHDPAGACIRFLQSVPGDAVLLRIKIAQINVNLGERRQAMSTGPALHTHITHVGLLLGEQR